MNNINNYNSWTKGFSLQAGLGVVAHRGVARNLIWVGINCTISNLSWVKETKQPREKFKVD